VLEARDLYRFYHAGEDETLALRGVSLSVMPGEMVAVVGPSGSGKSTLLNILAGLDDPDGGSVRVAGVQLSRRPEAERARIRAASIGVLMQSSNLIEHLSVLENVELARTLAGRRGSVSRPAHAVLEAVGLAEKAGASPSHLSGGQAARAGLAVALAGAPAVLLADEPTGEVDHESERSIIELLAVEAELGLAVIVVTHSDHVAAAASRVLRMRDGAVLDG
jgi:putative ABC transport system ATP-binding protein